MYNYTLKIYIYTKELPKNNLLKKAMENIEPLKGFNHSLISMNYISPETASGCHAIIWDGAASEDELSAVSNSLAADGHIILCVSGEEAAGLTEGIYKYLHGIWIKPISESYISFSFKRLMEEFKTIKDLHLVQTYLDTAIDSIPDLVWFKDIRGAHVKVNDAFCCAVGKTKEEIKNRGHYYIWDLTPEDYGDGEYVCLETEAVVIKEGKTCLFDEKVKTKGGMLQLKTYKSPIFDDDNKLIGTVGIAQDVTAFHNIDAELNMVLHDMPFALLVKNPNNTILSINKKFEEYFHIKKGDICGKNYAEWESLVLKNLQKPDGFDFYEATVELDNKTMFLEIHLKPILDIFNQVTGYLYLYQDFTLEHAHRQDILKRANTDYLTGLYNRRYLYEYFNENKNAEQISLLYIDLDNFKHVNDTYGHKYGDDALVLISDSLTKMFSKHTIFRLGGDEFLIFILHKHTKDQLADYAGKVLSGVENKFCQYGELKNITASIGISYSSEKPYDIDSLISQSDQALHIAKLLGKNKFCFWSEGQKP